MEYIAKFITKRRRLILVFFALTALCSAVLFFGVTVNYNMADYLPEDAESTRALELMSEEFSAAVPNTRVLACDVSITRALEIKAQLAAVQGVTEVMWLDDVVDLKNPLETLDAATVSGYYKDGDALFNVTIAEDWETRAIDDIYEIVGDDGGVSGNAANLAYSQNQVLYEVINAASLLVPLIVLILLLTTTSWMSPLFFLLTIAVAVLINMGTNVFLGSISYMTQAVSPVLQLAVSLDYAIFLLSSFERFRETEKDDERAMQLAIRQSFTSIAASAATTVFGFMALMFMRFGIGSDLGLNLVKGVILSYISVVVFLPALVLCCIRAFDKTAHRRIIRSPRGLGRTLVKVRIPTLILVLLLVVPCYLGQSRSDYFYGNGEPAPDSRYGEDTIKINERFGESTAIVLLVPRGDTGREAALCAQLQEIPHVTGVMSYVSTVGSSIPEGFVGSSVASNFYSENYARIILYTDTGEEGAEAFGAVEAVRAAAARYYDESWSCGQSTNIYDIKEVVTDDSSLVNGVAIAFVMLTLLISFRSLTLPLLLVFVIESAIWINLSSSYFTNDPLVYLGYLVINTVQLGATIDYAILITDGYMEKRRHMLKRQAVISALDENVISLMTSGLILCAAGVCLNFASSMEIVQTLGLLLARGTLLSLTLVLVALPALLMIFDPLTKRLTRAEFYQDKGDE